MRAAIVLLLALASPQAPDRPTRATVHIFATTDCPISNRYIPEIKRLSAKFSSQGAHFDVVFPVPTDTPELIRKHRREFDYDIPVMRDVKLSMVKAAGATITPQAVVYDHNSQLVYRGRIDDRYVDFGKERPQPTTRDLERVLEVLVAGKPVAFSETQAVGCYLPDLIK